MKDFILYSDVDQIIVDRSANQTPGIDKRVRAVNNELDELQTEYDLFDTVRAEDILVVTDGSLAYDTSTLVTDNDIKTIKDFNLGDDNNVNSPLFSNIDYTAFMRKVADGDIGNYYTLYTIDGVEYLRIITKNYSNTTETIKMYYHTSWKALDNAGDFIEKVTNSAGVKILLADRFKEMIALGALKRVFYQAIGEDSASQLVEIKRDYLDWKQKLGLTASKVSAKVERKIHLRKQW